MVSQCSVGTPGPRWEVFWWVARDLDFYGWVMYQFHAAARTQHTTPSFMGFWSVPGAFGLDFGGVSGGLVTFFDQIRF